MTEHDHDMWCCFSCGAVFDPFGDDLDPDDMHCPECESQDIGGLGSE